MSSATVKTSEMLLPHAIDFIANTEPNAVYAEFPRSPATYNSGFETVTFARFANAINGVAHLIEKTLGRPDRIKPLAYLAPNDPRCAITMVAAIKAGYAVWFPPESFGSSI
jgi:acyl-CoA synthetase (AMP-forming)/AMP-acid ligase II